jgi:nucleotide-binding universal stress UspA family protein
VVWGDEPLVAGYPYPIVMPGGSIVATASIDVHDQGHPGRPVNAPVDDAAYTAESVATEAGVFATSIGDVGDPSEAILRAADSHDADVIVVGSHDRGWFSRLVRPSVSSDVVRHAHVPVLVVR